MRTWVVEHQGIWPVGACTVVTAETQAAAAEHIFGILVFGIPIPLDKVKPDDWTWHEVETGKPFVKNILDGDY